MFHGRQPQINHKCTQTQVANEVLVRHPYNKEQDVERKRGIEIMQARTRAQLEDENAVRGGGGGGGGFIVGALLFARVWCLPADEMANGLSLVIPSAGTHRTLISIGGAWRKWAPRSRLRGHCTSSSC